MIEAGLQLICGNANRPLAQKIADHLKVPLTPVELSSFADGETRVEISANVRGNDVFILQPTSPNVNQNLMEALILADACKRSSALRLTLVAPYFGYSRQERKSAPRSPITAKLVANLITVSGFDRVLTMELHAGAIQGFFDIPVDHLFAKPVFVEYLQNYLDVSNTIAVSPDAGGVERTRGIAKYFDWPIAIVDKRRDAPNVSAVFNVIGDVKGKDCVIVDDIVDTAGSLTKAANALVDNGARSVVAVIAHPILSGDAIGRIEESKLKKLVVTDSIQLSEKATTCSKIVQISVSKLLADAIRNINRNDSVSSLFI